MADKARRLYSIAAVFSPGEQPTGSKMSAISTQAKASIDKLEFMVGDLWNAAGDLLLSPTGNISANALHIPNLARTIGKMSALNTMVPVQAPLSASMKYTDSFGARYPNETEGWLTYKPASAPTQFNMVLGGTFAPLVQGSFQTNANEVLVTGDWCVTTDGKLYAFDPVPSTLKLTYVPNIKTAVTATDGTNESGWNVIPDPSTWSGAYSGVKISFANNTDASTGFHIWLPPRKPLGASRLVYNSFASGSDNIQASPDVGDILPFQSTASNASLTNGNHYRYTLPTEVTGGAANSRLPSGFLYLWDEQFGTIIDNAAYYTPANTAHKKFKVRVTGEELEELFGALGGGIVTDDSTQLPADYITRFKVITTGVSLAKAVASLIAFTANHVHKNTDGSKAIPHANLDNLVTPSGGTNYPTSVPRFQKSNWVNDDHPQYLHRGGSTANTDRERDAENNCMYNWFIVKNSITDTELDLVVAAAGVEIASIEASIMFNAVQTGRSTSPAHILIGEGSLPGNWLLDNDNKDTMTIRGGGTTGVAQLVNPQLKRLYFGPDNVFDRSNSYLDWNNTTGVLTGVTDIGDNIFTIEADSFSGSFSGNDPASYGFGSSPVLGYFDLSPNAIRPRGETLNFTSDYNHISNDDAAVGFSGMLPVHLPNGVQLSAYPMSVAAGLGGGSTGDCIFTFGYYVKPTASAFSAPAFNTLSQITITASGTINTVVVTGAITPHDVDNTLNSYMFSIFLPHKNSTNLYRFYGGTIKYDMNYLSP